MQAPILYGWIQNARALYTLQVYTLDFGVIWTWVSNKQLTTAGSAATWSVRPMASPAPCALSAATQSVRPMAGPTVMSPICSHTGCTPYARPHCHVPHLRPHGVCALCLAHRHVPICSHMEHANRPAPVLYPLPAATQGVCPMPCPPSTATQSVHPQPAPPPCPPSAVTRSVCPDWPHQPLASASTLVVQVTIPEDCL